MLFHGIDLVDCRRIEKVVKRHGQVFLDRVFTAAEQKYCYRHRLATERLSGRFAVKEAVLKLIGTGWRNGIAWTDVETINDPAGKPIVKLHGVVAQLAKEMGVEQVSVSITHAADLAVASAIGLGDTTK
ncbi:MAG: holo-[acyl-carrier-protein] synthase [Desulfobulbaceae bacterium]|nr:holo-[acyl-carrier-protein] synthase [Desulfobulbaceae bacterium]